MKNCLFLVAGVLLGGLFALAVWLTVRQGHDRYIATDANIRFAVRILADVKKELGSVGSGEKQDLTNVIGRVHVMKDIDFAVYLTNGVKTIRAYE